jgi:hypothetical protein
MEAFSPRRALSDCTARLDSFGVGSVLDLGINGLTLGERERSRIEGTSGWVSARKTEPLLVL